MIPRDQKCPFWHLVRQAYGLARRGDSQAGAPRPALGLLWAEAPALDPLTGAVSPPDPWAGELKDLYRRTLVRYAQRFGPGAPSEDEGTGSPGELGRVW